MAEVSRDKYTRIFQTLWAQLPDYSAGMGDLISDSQEEGKARYEMRHQVGSETYLFPVFFIQDEHGTWQIYGL
jgi:hypothetical protein